MSTRRHATALVVATLAGTLALGACGAPKSSEEAPRGNGAAAVASRADAARLSELRLRYPTAGTEVPPADLVRSDASGHRKHAPLTQPTTLHRHAQ